MRPHRHVVDPLDFLKGQKLRLASLGFHRGGHPPQLRPLVFQPVRVVVPVHLQVHHLVLLDLAHEVTVRHVDDDGLHVHHARRGDELEQKGQDGEVDNQANQAHGAEHEAGEVKTKAVPPGGGAAGAVTSARLRGFALRRLVPLVRGLRGGGRRGRGLRRRVKRSEPPT